jgi:hypothetical protein
MWLFWLVRIYGNKEIIGFLSIWDILLKDGKLAVLDITMLKHRVKGSSADSFSSWISSLL